MIAMLTTAVSGMVLGASGTPATTGTPVHQGTLARLVAIEGDGLALMIVGMLVVFMALAIMSVILSYLVRLLADKPAATAATPAPAPQGVTESIPSGVPPHIVAVIAAAATAATQRPVRVRHVSVAGHGSDAWVNRGRESVMGSHRPRDHR